jgi:hypothetical protein
MRCRKPFALALLFAAGLFLGGYAAAQAVAEAAVREALARLREALGPDAVVEPGRIRVEPIAGRVRLESLTLGPSAAAPTRIAIADVVADDVRPGAAGVGRLSLHGIRLLEGGAEIGRIGSVTLEGLGLPAGPGTALADVTLDRLDVLDVAIRVPNELSLHVAYLSAEGIGGDRADAYEIQTLVLELAPGSPVERLEFAALSAENLGLLPSVLAALARRPLPTPPGVGRFEFSGLSVRAAGEEVLRIEELAHRSTAIEKRPGVTAEDLSISGFSVSLPPEASRGLLGLERIEATLSMAGELHGERGDYELRRLLLEIEGLAAIDLSGSFGGLRFWSDENPAETARLNAARLSIEDRGLLARFLAVSAREAGMEEAAFRRALAEQAAALDAAFARAGASAPRPERKGGPAPLSGGKPDPAGGLGGPLRGFIERGGTLEIALEPRSPLGVQEALGLLGGDPAAIAERLGLRLRLL